MALYRRILLALDFSEFDQQIAAKAQQLAASNQAELSLLHVVDNLLFNDAAYGSEVLNIEIAGELQSVAETRLRQFADSLHIPHNRCRVEIGSPKIEIVRAAQAQHADLIIVGTHSRNFLQEMLLGSTASGVLHHADCDVLAVRLKEKP
jgi:universal stress protein A